MKLEDFEKCNRVEVDRQHLQVTLEKAINLANNAKQVIGGDQLTRLQLMINDLLEDAK